MIMETFHTLCPEVGAGDYFSVELLHRRGNLPAGEYGFVELYCSDPGCACRNVHLNVIGGKPPRQLATINFSLDPDGFRDLGLEQSFLDPLCVQSEHSRVLLEVFRERLLPTAEFLARLERHLAMAKADAGRRRPQERRPLYPRRS